MCGIIGVFNEKNSLKLVKEGISIIKYRGKDGTGYYEGNNFSIAHCLHSIVNKVKQPLTGKGVFASNCEIYNWKELNKKYKLNAKNDSELLFNLLEKKKIEDFLDGLDGVYAFAYFRDNKLILARDILGIKPLWYSHAGGFSFASEKKSLEKLGKIDINELNPRKILIYDVPKDEIRFIERDFFEIEPEIKETEEKIIYNLNRLIYDAVKKRVPDKKFGLLFSGGIDSSLIAFILKKLGCNFTCYTSVLDDSALKIPEDLVFSEKVAKKLGLNLKIIKIKLKDIEKYLKKIVPLIEDSNVVKVGVALTFFAACEEAKKDKCKVIFSGLGSEEIFAGYHRHKQSQNINKECLFGLLKIYERDTYRDDVITMYNNLELRLPFLDKKLVSYALRIPEKYKFDGKTEKKILREAAITLGLNQEFAWRKKKAAQYGSNFHKALKKLSRKKKYERISYYLREFYKTHNAKLGALVSSGKDSLYAMYIMMKQNYPVECLITLKSKNPDSFMFHTPTIDLVKLQAESMNINLIEQETEGEQEKEIQDLKKALSKAKEKYKIEGIVTGALFSNYQRDRIERIADSLGLKIFSPLWHINQETELRELISNGFEAVITSVAADGLDKSWIGRKIDEKTIEDLKKLNKKNNINIAGEGGEYESLVVECPLFSKRIDILESKVQEDGISAKLIIKKARLADKNKN